MIHYNNALLYLRPGMQKSTHEFVLVAGEQQIIIKAKPLMMHNLAVSIIEALKPEKQNDPNR